MTATTRDRYDIIIVGGSMVGATLACALGDTGLHIAVVEAQHPVTDWSEEPRDLRVSALTSGSVRILDALGVWPRIAARRISPFREMHVWDAAGSGRLHFDSADIGADTLGYIVENRIIQAALREQVSEFDNVDWICPARICSLSHVAGDGRQSGPVTQIATEDGRLLVARLVVGADGSDSLVRSLSGITARKRDYQQMALVATVKTEKFHQETAWQRFLPGGPLAFLPLTDGYCSIVWSLPEQRAHALLALNTARFCVELGHALGTDYGIAGKCAIMGAVESTGPRAIFSLRMVHADHYVGEGVALIGDAAHTVHPLAGQGVNLGVSDAAVLAQIIGDSVCAGASPGAQRALRRYERWRKSDILTTMTGLEAIRQAFRSEAAPVRWARTGGLHIIDLCVPVKNQIMRHAMGIAGELPRLAQGA